MFLKDDHLLSSYHVVGTVLSVLVILLKAWGVVVPSTDCWIHNQLHQELFT